MIVIQAFFYALPIYIANTAPVVFKKVPFLGLPIDGGKTFRGKRIFGSHKTWRGVFFAILFGGLTVLLQQYLLKIYPNLSQYAIYDYSNNVLALGLLMGAGAIIGDAIKSFFKRQVGKKPGSMWFPFDQLDLIIGGLVLSSFIYWPGWNIAMILLIITPFLHFLTNYISYKIGVKNVPW